MQHHTSREEDLLAIEAISRRDVQFALENDANKMMSQWTDDIVLLQPAGPIMRGRAAIAQAFEGIETPECRVPEQCGHTACWTRHALDW